MNTESMRWIDSRVGVPICFALTLLRRLTEPVTPPTDAPQRILIVKLGEQGATVVAYSALRRAIDMVGADNVHMMVFAENRFIVDQLGLLPEANVITVRTTSATAFVGDVLRAVRRSRRLGVDTAVDFEFFARSSAILTYLSGARRRVGFHAHHREASYRGDLMTHRLVANTHLHAGETFLRLIDAVEVEPTELPALDLPPAALEVPPVVVPTDAERERVAAVVDGLLGAAAGGGLRLVLLNANASDLIALRRWPADRYVELARRLLDEHPDIAVVFTGSAAEADDAEQLVARVGSDRCVSMGGRTTMRELLVLYGLAEVMVTNDSGPAHYAALAPLDVVTLFGPETPKVFGSLSDRSHLLWAGLPCSPCVNAFNDRTSPCRDNVCMQRITVDEVHDLVTTILAARREAARP